MVSQLIGYVTVVGVDVSALFTGFTAGFMLGDDPTRDILLIGSEHRLQTALEAGVVSGHQVHVMATKLASNALPGGGYANGELFEVSSVTVYNCK
jgi:hypothetical protein